MPLQIKRPRLPQSCSSAAENHLSLASHSNKQSPLFSLCWSSSYRRRAWVFFLLLLVGTSTVMLLSPATLAWLSQTTHRTTTNRFPEASPVVATRVGNIHLYPFPPNVGLMQPGRDAQGHIWVGEMTGNLLARLDPQTGSIATWQPPNARDGMMTTTVDTQGRIWFVEQNANYLGRFDPQLQTFQTFPLGTAHGRPLGPQALQFDASGKLWFTGYIGGQIGRLDPATGAITLWDVSPICGCQYPYPFGLAVTPTGQVWFGLLFGGAIGHLDPATGRITLYHLRDPKAAVYSMSSDTKGRLWFTELMSGTLGMIDPATNQVVERSVPASLGRPAGLYAIVTTQQNTVWFVSNNPNSLIRYEPVSNTYTFYQMADSSAAPYGLTLDPTTGWLWFTSINSIGELTP